MICYSSILTDFLDFILALGHNTQKHICTIYYLTLSLTRVDMLHDSQSIDLPGEWIWMYVNTPPTTHIHTHTHTHTHTHIHIYICIYIYIYIYIYILIILTILRIANTSVKNKNSCISLNRPATSFEFDNRKMVPQVNLNSALRRMQTLSFRLYKTASEKKKRSNNGPLFQSNLERDLLYLARPGQFIPRLISNFLEFRNNFSIAPCKILKLNRLSLHLVNVLGLVWLVSLFKVIFRSNFMPNSSMYENSSDNT